MSERLSQFHFIQPEWLLALLPLIFIYWIIQRQKTSENGWSKVIDAHLLPVLINKNLKKTGRSFSILLMLAWIISVLALANPVWEKRPMPVFQTNTAHVIVLDLSRSMTIPDIKPSRLERARFKIEDILAREEEGQIGLVVFAGDAFAVTPLTRDADTIRALLESLTPSIMPIQGSRADLGLLKAGELLTQAAVPQGHILLIADGAEASSALDAAKQLRKQGYVISVLSIGTKEGAAIPKVHDSAGRSIVVGLDEAVLKEIAVAGGGRYHTLSSNSADLDDLLSVPMKGDANEAEKNNDLQSQDWQSEGPWLVLLLLPLAALAFRRGWLLSVGLVFVVLGALGQPQSVMASVFDNLWTRQDQQADSALQAGDYEKAQQLAEDPLRRGSAAFKKKDYEQALSDFSQLKSADGLYNKGNALASLKKFEEAIEAYNEAIKQQPDLQDAKDNKAKIEALLKKQKEQKKKQDKQDKKDQKDSKEQNQDKKEGQENKDQQGEKSKDQQSDQKQSDKDKQEEEDKKNQENQFDKANKQQEEEKDKTEEEKSQSTPEEQKKQKEQEQQKLEQAKAGEEKPEGKEGQKNAVKATADELSKEEKIAAEQWLRRVPDDPGGLLKRKFRYQYRRRGQQPGTGDQRPW